MYPTSDLINLYHSKIRNELGLGEDASDDDLVKACQDKGIIHGGREMKMGGMESLGGYEKSHMSRAKAKLIRDIASDVASKLKLKGLDPKEKDLDKLVKALRDAIPDPTKDGRKFNKNKSVQERVCRVMAEVINQNYGTKVVDPKGDMEEVCEGISEVMHTLMSGLHAEFIGVREDMRRVLGNLETLRAYLDLIQKAMKKIASDSDDSATGASLKKLSDFSDAVVIEVARQIKLLENMAGIADSREKSLDELMAKEKGLKTLVKRIKSAPGSAKFGEKVALMLSGVGTMAYAAAEVDSALKQLGISHKQYKDLKEFKKLRDEVNESLLEKLDDVRSEEQFRKMIAAADIILRNDYRHADIVAHLEKKHGGAYKTKSPGKKNGSAPASGGTSLSKRLDRREKIRKRLLKAFNQQLQDIFERVLSLNKMLVSRVGTELARGEDLRRFVNAFLELNPVQDRKVYYSLSGWANDIAAKQVREKFQSQIDQVIYALDSFKEPKAKSAADGLKKAFQDLAKMIKDMEGAFENLPVVTFRSKKGAEERPLAAAEGGDECGYSGNANIAKINYTINKAQRDLLYFYHTSKVFESTKLASEELKTLKEEYPKVLGDALAKKLDDLANAKKQLKDVLAKESEGLGQALSAKYTSATGTPSQDPKDEKEEFIKLSNKMNDALAGLYQAAEAVDRYMLEFTDAALRDPKSVEELKIMLDQTEIISDWFDELSGNLLCQSFEAFPGEFIGADPTIDTTPITKDMLKDEHYYESVLRECKLPTPDVNIPNRGAMVIDNNDYSAVNLNGMGAGANGLGDPATYTQLAAWVRGPFNAGGKSPENLEMERKNRLVAARTGAPKLESLSVGNPFLGIPSYDKDGATERAVEGACKAVNNLSVLKNLISAFASIGKSLGGEAIYKKTNMTPHQIFMKLNEYLKYSAFVLGPDRLTGHTGKAISDGKIDPASSLVQDAAGMGVGSAAMLADLATDGDATRTLNDRESVRKSAYLAMAPASGAGGTIGDVWKCKFTYADDVFQMIVKSMAAKVMTVVGLYNLIHKPIEKQAFGKQFTDLRLVLGGADTYPEVLDGAMELYLRLPLLAELYRHVFGFYENRDPLVTMIPENMGLFGGLIDLVFTKSRYVEEGSYSSTDAAMLVAEINKIYNRFKDSKTPVSDVIHAFVGEMNTSFGLITEETRNKYLADRYRNQALDKFSAETLANESILPGGEYEDEPSKASYADRYRSASALDAEYQRKYKYEIGPDNETNFKQLRDRLTAEFDGIDFKSTEWDQFDKVIKSRKEELKHARDRKQRFEVAMALINGFGSLSIESMAHSLVLFHETVITGLFTIQGLYDQTKHFASCLKDMADSIDAAKNWADNDTVGNALPPLGPNGELAYLDRTGVLGTRQRDAGASGGMTAVQVAALDPAAGDNEKAARYRFAIDQGKMLKHLIEVLFAYQDLGDLTDVKIDKCNVLVDNSKVRAYVEQQLRNLKGMVDKFRGVLPCELVNTFESSQNSCGLYYLEQNFLNEFIMGTPTNDKGEQPKLILDKSNTYLEKITKYLTTKWSVEPGAAAAGAGTIAAVAAGARKGQQFDRELCELVFWDAFKEPVLADASDSDVLDLDDDTIGKVHTNPFDKDAEGTAPGNVWAKLERAAPGPVRARIYQEKAVTNHRSLLDLFNQMLGMYLSSFYDQANGKIYLPLIGEFANGTFNVQVMKDETVRDIASSRDVASDELLAALRAGLGAGPGLVDAAALLAAIPAGADAYLRLMAGAYARDAAAVRGVLPRLDPGDRDRIQAAIAAGRGGALDAWIMDPANGFTERVRGWYSLLQEIAGAANVNAGCAAFLARINRGLIGVAGEPGSVLVSSLGLALKRMMTLQGRGGTKQYIEADLAEIPLYMRESYKAKIPIFRKLFTLLRDKASLIRKFTEQLNVRRPTTPTNAAAVPAVSDITAMSIAAPTDESSDALQKKLLVLIDQVRNGCTSLLNGMTEVMDQIDDDPKYLETYTGSIKDYETQHGYAPMMPYSSLAYYLKCQPLNAGPATSLYSEGTSLPGMPIWPMGNPHFKLQFGSRGVLSAESVDLSDFPSTRQSLKHYNETTDGRHSLSESDVSKLLMTNTCMLKYLAENQQLKRFLSSLNDATAVLGATGRYPCNVYCDILSACNPTQEPCAYRQSIEKVIELVEEDDMKEAIHKLANCARATEECRSTRKEMRARNVLDLNIVPINLTMLGREVPLVNLYNYSYTFDKFVRDMFGCNNRALDNNDTPAQALGKLLCNPYQNVSFAALYGGLKEANVGAIFRGGVGKDLGRPRFLGDHLYNKALFGELYKRGSNGELADAAGVTDLDSRGAEISSALRAKGNAAPYTLGIEYGDGLNYPEVAADGKIKTKRLIYPLPAKAFLRYIGKLRFDTKLVRNIVWLTNLQRAMRLKLSYELEWYDTRIISGHALLNPMVTEIHGINIDDNTVADPKKLRDC